jgi:NAD(P)H-dependent FMN reductase/ketosteroid isomerase-like protein
MDDRRLVAVLVGSLRRESLSRKLAKALIAHAPASLECRIVEIGDLSLYNEDLESDVPASWVRFRTDLKAAAAVLFVTPEYNRSIPGGLKNALDVGSRPPGQSVFAKRPAGVVSVTPYQLGAFGANHALRQTFAFLDMPVLQQPEAYVPKAGELFDDKGELKSEETRKFIQSFMSAFGQWIEKTSEPATSGSFKDFMARRASIARAYVNGDGAPLEAITAHSGSASFFPPVGGMEQGATTVAARYQKDVQRFSPGSESTLEIIQSGDSGDVGFWTGLQTAKVKMQGSSEAREMKLRITELFRRIGGEWKLVHRHADMLAQASRPPGD